MCACFVVVLFYVVFRMANWCGDAELKSLGTLIETSSRLHASCETTGFERDGDGAVDALFDDLLHVATPFLPVQTLLLSFHIMQKRARQFIDDARFFVVEQVVWLVMALMMLLVPRSSDSGWQYVGEVVFALALTMSACEVLVYVVGHGFVGSSKYGRSSEQLRILSVLRVWSPPRYRRRGDVEAQQYQVQTPILSDPFLRAETVVIVLSIISYGFDKDGFGRLRYLHGLRCARLLYGLSSAWHTLHRVIATLKSSLPGLSTAMVLLTFFLLIFGIAGVDQFSTNVNWQCLLPATYDSNLTSCRYDASACIAAQPALYCDPTGTEPSVSSPFVCRGEMQCTDVGAPNYGLTSFDDILRGALLMVQMTSLTDWWSLMQAIWSSSPRILVGVYSALLIIVVSYIVLNFVVAIMCSAYSEQRRGTNPGVKSKLGASVSLLNFRITEFLWWTISLDAQYHLSVPSAKQNGKRVPFFNHVSYTIGRDLWLLLLVVSHATNSASATEQHVSYLRALEIVNIIILSSDVALSITASGSIGKYLLLAGHRFDMLAFLLTIIGLGLDLPLSVFRFGLVGHWLTKIPVLRRSSILQQGLVAAPGTLMVSLVLLLFLFVGGAVAVQLFSVSNAAAAAADDWSDPWNSIVTMFRFVTLDGWSYIMYDGVQRRGAFVGLCFFLPTYLLFGYIIRGLFTSVVVDAFDPNNEDKVAWQHRIHRAFRQNLTPAKSATVVEKPPTTHSLPADRPTRSANNAAATYASEAAPEEDEKVIPDKSFFILPLNHPIRRLLLQLVTVPTELAVPESVHFEDGETVESKIPYRCFGNAFQFVIILCVLGSCVSAADPPSEACSERQAELNAKFAFTSYTWLDGIFAGVFTLEAIIKMIAHGALMKGTDRGWYVGAPYLKDTWNLLDLALLVVMYVSFVYPQVSALRLMRILRPLRIIRRFRKMRLLMQGVFKAMPGVLVALVCAAVMLILFAIVGVAKFRGAMYECNVNEIGGTVVRSRAECSGLFLAQNGVMVHASWDLQVPNFDSVVDGMTYLLQIVGLSSWTELLARATAVVGRDQQPKPKSQLQNSLFFFVFVVLANSFVVNVIVGVIVASFDEQRGIRYLTLQQRMYSALQDVMESMYPIPPPPVTRFPKILKLVRWSMFELFLNGVVLLNIGVLVSSHANQSDGWTAGQFYLNTICTFIFLLEAVLKIMALGRHYFSDPWNVVDALIMAGSMVEFSIQISSNNQAVTITSVGRAFRILRVLRSVRRVPSLNSMFVTLGNSMPAILSIFVVMIMVVFMYSVVGMQVLGHLRFQNAITKDTNFRDYVTGWFTVFRMLTLDNWDAIMQDAMMAVGEYCNRDETGWWYLDLQSGDPKSCGTLNDCGSVLSGRMYFFSFYILSAFFFSSVVVAILLDSFRLNSSSARAAVRSYDLERFRMAWLKARRVVGEESFYGLFIERELMSLLCMALFNDENGLVLNRANPERHIHPVLTSRTRLNFRKIVFELDYVSQRRRQQLTQKLVASLRREGGSAADKANTGAERIATPQVTTASPLRINNRRVSAFREVEAADHHLSAEDHQAIQLSYPEGTYEFHDVLEVLCRFQMGDTALTFDQKVLRDIFVDNMNALLLGRRIKEAVARWLARARQQVGVYNLETMSSKSDHSTDEDDVPVASPAASSDHGDENRPENELMAGDTTTDFPLRVPFQFPREPAAAAAPTVVRRGSLLSRMRTPSVVWQHSPIEEPETLTVASDLMPSSAVAALEAVARLAVHHEVLESVEMAFRRFHEVAEHLQWEAMMSKCSAQWLDVLLRQRQRRHRELNPPYLSLRLPTQTAPTVQDALIPSNPLRSLNAPLLWCPDDTACNRYLDPQHTSVRRHTCRRGVLCRNETVEHRVQFAHDGDTENEGRFVDSASPLPQTPVDRSSRTSLWLSSIEDPKIRSRDGEVRRRHV